MEKCAIEPGSHYVRRADGVGLRALLLESSLLGGFGKFVDVTFGESLLPGKGKLPGGSLPSEVYANHLILHLQIRPTTISSVINI